MFTLKFLNDTPTQITFTHVPDDFVWIDYPNVYTLEEGELITINTKNTNVIRAIQLYLEKKVYLNLNEEIMFTRRLSEKDDVFIMELSDIAEKICCQHLFNICTKLLERITKKIQQIEIK
jgi:hypothetical protein